MTHIVSFTPKLSSSVTTKWAKDGYLDFDGTQEFDIIVSDSKVDATWVMLNAPFPPRGAQHGYAPNYYSTGEPAVTQISPIHFVGKIQYKTIPESENSNQQQKATPREREGLQITYDSVENEEGMDYDERGYFICDTFQHQFDPPLTRTVSDGLMTITNEVPYYDEFTAMGIRNSVNSDYWRGIPPGAARITKYIGSYHQDANGNYFWRRTVIISIRGEKASTQNDWTRVWWKRVRCESFYVSEEPDISAAEAKKLNANTTVSSRAAILFPDKRWRKIKRQRDATGSTLTSPGLVDRMTGAAIEDPTQAHWIDFQAYKERDFNTLDLL